MCVCVCVCVCACVYASAGGQQLAVTDADTAPDELEFELVEAPAHGNLVRVDFSSQTPMSAGERHAPTLRHCRYMH